MDSKPPTYFDLPSGSVPSSKDKLSNNHRLSSMGSSKPQSVPKDSSPSSNPNLLSYESNYSSSGAAGMPVPTMSGSISSTAAFLSSSSSSSTDKSGRGIWDYIRRMRHFRQMDWEYTMWQMVYVCFQPKKVYSSTKYHKQTKNQWARDDPGFVVLMMCLLMFAVLSWSAAFANNASQTLKMFFYVPIVDYIIFSLIISSATWFISNKFLLISNNTLNNERSNYSSSSTSSMGAVGSHHIDNNIYSDKIIGSSSSPSSSSASNSSSPFFLVKQQVEWFYCFDVHCNSFFPAFLLLHVIHFLLVPLLITLGSSFFGTFLSNTLFLIAFSYYHYITCLGFTALPFLQGTDWFLSPILIIFVAYFISLLLNFNLSFFFLNFYFPIV